MAAFLPGAAGAAPATRTRAVICIRAVARGGALAPSAPPWQRSSAERRQPMPSFYALPSHSCLTCTADHSGQAPGASDADHRQRGLAIPTRRAEKRDPVSKGEGNGTAPSCRAWVARTFGKRGE